MNKILSIVVAIYNMEKFLDKCLTSLIVEDCVLMNKFEVIAVNDGSKDSSSEIAHKYANKYPGTFKVIDKVNGNHGSCYNAGMAIATGKYIHFLDSDDWFDTCFDKYLENLTKLDADVIITKRVDEYMDTGASLIHCFPKVTYNKLYNAKNFDYTLVSHDLFSLHECSYKLSLLKENNIKFTEGCFYADTILRLAPFPAIKTFYLLDMPLYHYLLNRPGQSVAPDIYIKRMGMLEQNVFYLLDHAANIDDALLSTRQRLFVNYVFNTHVDMLIGRYKTHRTKTRIQDLRRCYRKLSTDKHAPFLKDNTEYKRLKQFYNVLSLYIFITNDVFYGLKTFVKSIIRFFK